MRFVVIGGDAAGMSAASRARRLNPDLEITVLERTADVSYSACGMPYNIADPEREMDDLVVRKAQVFREKQAINLLTGHEARNIDPLKRMVRGRAADGASFEIPYDRLLIATGASPIRPDLPGFDQEGVMTLKTLDQGRHLKHYLKARSVRNVVVIGMGYIALEMCEALHARGITVAMVKPRPHFLPWMQAEMARVVQDEVESKGVDLYPGYTVEGIEKTKEGFKVSGPDLTLEGDMVLVAIGVTPNSGIAQEAGIDLSVGRSIGVDARLQTSVADIFAAGDCADAIHVVSGKKVWVPLALRANRAGWAVADNVCGQTVALPGIAGTAVFKVFDLEVARTGFNEKEATEAGFDPIAITIKSRSRAHAHPGADTIWVQMTGDKTTGRLLGVQMVGREGVAHRINAAAVALQGSMSVERFSQSDLAYAPPFGPVWDPLLTAANQLIKKI
jgi:NADPH-dependent 2,4-dienoyl-CoA reductase/sulfur reductase-like enzyme